MRPRYWSEESEDASTGWERCGYITGHNGNKRSIFVHASADDPYTYALRLLPAYVETAKRPPNQREIQKDAGALIETLKRTGPFTLEEQSEFARCVEYLASDEPEIRCAFDPLFDEVLSRKLGGWESIGSHSGTDRYGGFHSSIYARRDHPIEPKWTVVTRASDGNYKTRMTDNGSGESIFTQFMREHGYYENSHDKT